MALRWQNLTNEEKSQTLMTHKLVVDYSDLLTYTSGTAFALFPQPLGTATTPGGTFFGPVAVYVNTTFAGTGPLTALTLSIGDGTTATRYLNAANVFTTAGWKFGAIATTPFGTEAADTIDGVLTATGGTLAALTAGRFTVFAHIADFNRLL